MSNIYLKVTIQKIWCSQNFDFLSLKLLSPDQILGSSNNSLIIGIYCIRMYDYFYWCMHDFGNLYVDMYAPFFPQFLKKFSQFFCFLKFYTVQNLLLYIWPLIALFVYGRKYSLLFTFALKKPYFSIFHTNI